MEVASQRKIYYDELFNKIDPIKNDNGVETYSVPYQSNTEYIELQVYEIDIGDFKTGLRLNLENTRILYQKLKEESKRKKKFDPHDESTQGFLQKYLLENGSYLKNTTKNLKEELMTTGQREPAIISCDGIIWDGNRRIAIRKMLFKETSDPKWQRVKVVRLPPLNLKQLKQLTHRLQMTKTFKEDYGSITFRLRCKDAIKNEEWSYDELINSFRKKFGRKEIDEFIEDIYLIEEYLKRINHPNDYPLIKSKSKGNGVEIFAPLRKTIKLERKNNTKEDKIEKIKTIFFSIIFYRKSIFQHTRDLAKLLKNQDMRKQYFANSPIYNNYSEYRELDNDGVEKALSLEISNKEYDHLVKIQRMWNENKSNLS